MRDCVLLMVGTRKGAFIFTSDRERRRWKPSGPHFAGNPVFHIVCDQRGGGIGDDPSLYAAINSPIWGREIAMSGDLGRTWKSIGVPKYPTDSGLKVERVWQLATGSASQPGVLYAGVEPAGLFVSRDGGPSWEEVEGLNHHSSRRKWQPGGGGLCLHTILLDPGDPQRMWVGISAAGVFRSEDGGKTWVAANRGIRADFLPEKYPEAGQCIHKMDLHPSRPQVLYQQNHCGMYRSLNAGDTWEELRQGLPSTFGFPAVVHPHQPETVYLVPLESDENRVPPDGRLAVYRSRDGGETWQACRRGLPRRAYVTILRDGLAVDDLEPAGVYVGSQDGTIFASRDDGDSWYALARYLPPVLSVTCTTI